VLAVVSLGGVALPPVCPDWLVVWPVAVASTCGGGACWLRGRLALANGCRIALHHRHRAAGKAGDGRRANDAGRGLRLALRVERRGGDRPAQADGGDRCLDFGIAIMADLPADEAQRPLGKADAHFAVALCWIIDVFIDHNIAVGADIERRFIKKHQLQ